jgi:hypothetical protein
MHITPFVFISQLLNAETRFYLGIVIAFGLMVPLWGQGCAVANLVSCAGVFMPVTAPQNCIPVQKNEHSQTLPDIEP